MESDIGRDVQRTLFGLAVIYVIHMTVKRRLGRIEEAIWWALIGAALMLLASAIWFPGLGPAETVYDNGGTPVGTTGGQEGLLWVLVAASATFTMMLSLVTWDGAQIRRTRREMRREVRRQGRLDRKSAQMTEWQRKAMEH